MNTTLRPRAAVIALACALAGAWPASRAEPANPASDDEIVERLPPTWDGAARRQHSQGRQQPLALGPAVEAARAALQRARRSGDPREFGLAQARLRPWWHEATPPPEVRLLRATVLQARHEFDAALVDLGAVADDRAAPPVVRAQARLTQAAVLQVTGRLAEAAHACAQLAESTLASLGTSVAVPAQVCAAELLSLRGPQPQAQSDAARRLDQLASQVADDPWLALVRAELAERHGDLVMAEARFRRAAAGGGDAYAAAAFADFLLDSGRSRDALALLQSTAWRDITSDALQLRRAIAWQRLGDPHAAAAVRQLAEQFDAARLRGERLHAREEARLALDLLGDAERAWSLARSAWAQQKEPADAVLLARAALASGRPFPMATLREWVPDPLGADRRLAALARQAAPGQRAGS